METRYGLSCRRLQACAALVEHNPAAEGVEITFLGTIITAQVAEEQGVSVRAYQYRQGRAPTSIMGASKRLAEDGLAGVWQPNPETQDFPWLWGLAMLRTVRIRRSKFREQIRAGGPVSDPFGSSRCS